MRRRQARTHFQTFETTKRTKDIYERAVVV